MKRNQRKAWGQNLKSRKFRGLAFKSLKNILIKVVLGRMPCIDINSVNYHEMTLFLLETIRSFFADNRHIFDMHGTDYHCCHLKSSGHLLQIAIASKRQPSLYTDYHRI